MTGSTTTTDLIKALSKSRAGSVQSGTICYQTPSNNVGEHFKLFLSYTARFRATQVQQIANFLCNEGFAYYLSPGECEKTHDSLPELLSKAISEVDLVIIFVSSEYQKVVNCKNEAIFAAIDSKKRIIIVKMEREMTVISNWLQQIIDSSQACLELADDGEDNFATFQQQLIAKLANVLKPGEAMADSRGFLEMKKMIQTAHVPIFPEEKYYKRRDKTDDLVLDAIIDVCLNPFKGFKLLTGDGGIGKTTLVAHVLHDRQNRQKLGKDLGMDVVIWVNCYDWLITANSNGIDEAERAFARKLNKAVKDYGFNRNDEDDINKIVANFQNEKVLFVFDDVFDAKLLQFFLKCQKTPLPCCVITTPDSLASQLNEAKVKFSEFKIPQFAAEEVAAMLSATFNLVKKVQDGKILKMANDSICCGSPLIANLLSGQFSVSNDCETIYQLLVSSLSAIGKLDVSNKDRPGKTVDHLVDFILNQLSDLEQRRYYAMLFFDPVTPILPGDLSLFWGFEQNSNNDELVVRIFEFYERRRLVQISRNNENGELQFTIHQAVYHSAKMHAINVHKIAVTDDGDFSCFLLDNVVGGLAGQNMVRSNGGREMVLFEAVRRHRRHLLRQIIAKMNAENLAQLCLQTSLLGDEETFGKSFIHFLYNYSDWPGDENHPQGHLLEKFDRNTSYELIGEILAKLKSSDNRDLLQLFAVTSDFAASPFLMSLFDDEKKKSQFWNRRPLIHAFYPWKVYYEEAKWRQDVLSKSEVLMAASRENIDDLKRFNAQEVVPVEKLREVFHVAARCNAVKVARFLFRKNPSLITLADCNGWTALHFACCGGHIDMVRFLIEKGSPTLIAKSDKKGMTPLDQASRCGHLDIVRYLLDRDPTQILDVNGDGKTILHYASEMGHLDVVRYLMDKSLTLTMMTNENGWTALHFATRNGQNDVASFLIDQERKFLFRPNNQGRLPLHFSAEDGQLEMVRFMLEIEPSLMTSVDSDQWTAFHYAAANGHVEIVRYMADRDCSLIARTDTDKWTPLQMAACSGHLETVRVLLEKDVGNVVVVLANSFNETALHFAAASGQLEIVRLLVEKGVSADQNYLSRLDDDGWSALHYAASGGQLEIVRFLIEKDETLISGNNDSTPLQVAAESGHCEIVNYFFENFGNSMPICDKNGVTPLHYAARGGHVDTLRCVLQKDPTLIAAVDNGGRTALHYSAGYGNLEGVCCLIEKQPSLITMTDNDGRTPFHYAAANGHLGIVRYFFDKDPSMISQKNKSGLTALHFATENGHIEVITYLIEKDPNNFVIAVASAENGRRWADAFWTSPGNCPRMTKRNSLIHQRQHDTIPEAANEN